MYCYYCYWGWSKPVYDIYKEAVKLLGGADSVLHFGPSHIVWEDENWDSAKWCLEHFEEYSGPYSKEELDVCRWSLEELEKVPLELRCIEPEDYDGEHPELFPPKIETFKHWEE